LGGVGTFGVVACVQEVAVTPGELLADADLIHHTMGASEKDEEEAIRKGGGLLHKRKASDGGLVRPIPCEARFRDWKLGPAKAHYL
jgi:hypothetical protein